MALDPVTVEVIGAALASIVEEMGEALVRASFSTNIKERRDCSTVLMDAGGRTLCQAEHIPIHLGSFLDALAEIEKRHDPGAIVPGDVFIFNDAYAGGGTHLPDIVLAEPVFVDGTIAAWAMNLAHHADFADRGHAHIFQEGIRIPPVRLYAAGDLRQGVLDLILLNCQVPRERISDLRAQMAANRLGVARFQDLCTRHGRAVVLEAGAALMDYAERRMRAGIAAIPDGVYRFQDRHDGPELEGEGEIEIGVAVTVAGDAMRLDFEAPPQLRAGINMTMTALLATVYYALKAVVDLGLPPNAGLARPVTVTAPLGSVLNCVAPAAVHNRLSLCQRVVDLVLGALAQAVPGRVTAAHNGACTMVTFAGAVDGGPWVYLETIGGGFGARADRDGLDGVHVHTTNTSNLPVEALEPEYPLTLLEYSLVEGSGGAGRHRGGMGLRRVYRAEAPCRVELDMARMRSAPWGLAGGGPGGMGRIEYGPGVAPLAKGQGALETGQVFGIVTPGAGGYGAA